MLCLLDWDVGVGYVYVTLSEMRYPANECLLYDAVKSRSHAKSTIPTIYI
jgi:hypothetical protein